MHAIDSKQAFLNALDGLPEPEVKVLLKFVEFLRLRQEHEGWTESAARVFADRYGPGEPEYSAADLKPELDR